jgi:hypothetical protein
MHPADYTRKLAKNWSNCAGFDDENGRLHTICVDLVEDFTNRDIGPAEGLTIVVKARSGITSPKMSM